MADAQVLSAAYPSRTALVKICPICSISKKGKKVEERERDREMVGGNLAAQKMSPSLILPESRSSLLSPSYLLTDC